MKNLPLTLCLGIAALLGSVGSGFASDLPPCSSLPFHDCFGTYTWANGDKYVGEWKDDKLYGRGTYTFVNGTVKKGIWKDDEFRRSKKMAVHWRARYNNNLHQFFLQRHPFKTVQ